MNIEPIALVESCFKEKFAIPRQPLLAPSARGRLRILSPFDKAYAFEGIEHASHLWLIFGFHKAEHKKDRLKVRPPRLGGNKNMGVFATRSTHRPNNLGLSVVRFEGVSLVDALYLNVSGIDLLDGTPVYDIKPYLPYSDNVIGASHALAQDASPSLSVSLSIEALRFCAGYRHVLCNNLELFLREVLSQDPAPAYHARDGERLYGVRLLDLEVKWRYLSQDELCIESIERLA